MAPPGEFAFGKVRLPAQPVDDAPPSSRSHRMRTTLHGIGVREECPSMPECQLAFMAALNERDTRWELRLSGIETRLSQMHTVLDQWLSSKSIRNSDSTPAQRGTINIEIGPAKFRGRWWVIAAVLLLLGAMGAGAYVLAQWGRPGVTIAQPGGLTSKGP